MMRIILTIRIKRRDAAELNIWHQHLGTAEDIIINPVDRTQPLLGVRLRTMPVLENILESLHIGIRLGMITKVPHLMTIHCVIRI